MSCDATSPNFYSGASISSTPSSRLSSPSPVSTMSDTNTTASLTASSSLSSQSTPFSTSSDPLSNMAEENPISPPFSTPDAPIPNGDGPPSAPQSDVDPQIIEALRSKDRLYVLKLGELMEGLVNDRRPRIDLAPTTSYQRLLVHRCSAYYKLLPENDPTNKHVIIALLTAESRIPPRRMAELVPPEASAHPAFKIMRRRALPEGRSKPQSRAGSAAGEEADLSDVEPSEAGSLGSRSNATGGSSGKKHMTIEEREAAYNEARSRIFMDFAEKEKDKDMSASSSSVSITSGSISGGGSSVAGDFDDSASSLATESEWSGPSYGDRRENRRNGGSRSLRPSAPPFTSREPSPSFTYATLYDPQNPPYPTPPNAAGFTHYVYPYPPPGQPPNPPYPAPYPYYPSYIPYGPPPPPMAEDSTSPSTGEMYGPAPPHMYMAPYMWPPHPLQPPIQSPNQSQQLPGPIQNAPLQPPQNASQYQAPQPQFPPPSMYGYPMPGYYTPQPPLHAPPHIAPTFTPPAAPYVGSPGLNTAPLPRQSNGEHQNSQNHPRGSNRNNNAVNGNKPHTAPAARQAWSYGPGIGGGVPFNGSAHPSTLTAGESVGPRFGSVRRLSNNSNASYRSSNNDEASSTASSSTTSSSSRRTFTSSTSSSHHPLPARPDWAVGLKPNNRQNNGPPGSPRGNTNGNHSSRRPPAQSMTDFPPLSSTEKRAPIAAGAWTNTSRSIIAPPLQFPPSIQSHANGRLDDDSTFQRPPPRATELFNPKVVKRPNNGTVSPPGGTTDKDKVSVLNEQIRGMSVGEHGNGEGPSGGETVPFSS